MNTTKGAPPEVNKPSGDYEKRGLTPPPPPPKTAPPPKSTPPKERR
jgi:hypothetical protein